MNQKRNENVLLTLVILGIILSVLLSACATTVITTPTTYKPSLLRKNPAEISYYVDERLKTLTENYKGIVQSYKLEVGSGLYSSIKNMLNEIFYNPDEIAEITDKKNVIKFTYVNSNLTKEPGGRTFYKIEIRVEIFKNGKKIDDVVVSGEGECPTVLDDYKGVITIPEEGKISSERAITKVINQIGEFLNNYKFE
ncbi:MAG: hypothetical protein NC926_11225 [Candidatus Omnitrophica bacterium]|nr:hypothetical protein [Candidatus Omnitrophota bacterium]